MVQLMCKPGHVCVLWSQFVNRPHLLNNFSDNAVYFIVAVEQPSYYQNVWNYQVISLNRIFISILNSYFCCLLWLNSLNFLP